MNAEVLLNHFSRISEAPDAIPRLRRFILDLAARGKLVEQRPTDDPASDLVERIKAEKARLVKAGELRRDKPLPPIEDAMAPFDVPATWEWVPIRQVTSDRGQKIPDRDFTYIDVTAINKEAGCVSDPKVLSAAEAPSRARKLVQTGDVLYSCVRPYLLNIAVIERDIDPPPIASTAFAVLNGHSLVMSRYLWIVLRSGFMVEAVESRMRGQAYPAINDSDFATLPFPLPPLAEQHRIVAKVDELMALCDRLEEAQTEREARRNRLTAASQHHLNNHTNRDELRQSAQFFITHVLQMTTRLDQIDQLRQTVINLAIRGDLTQQDPVDECASELLKRIRLEKVELANGRNFRADLVSGAPDDSQPPFDIPRNWQWTTIGQLAHSLRYGTSVKCSYETNGVPVLRIPNVDKGRIDLSDLKFGQLPDREVEELQLRLGDIVIVRSNGSLNLVGRPALVESHCVGFCYAGYLVRVRVSTKHLNTRYIILALTSEHVRNQIERPIRTTVGLKNVNSSELNALAIPLPPLAEQERIITVVDELMALFDRLQHQLAKRQREISNLLEAVLCDSLIEAQ